MTVLNLKLDVNNEERTSKAVVQCNEEDFDPEALEMIKGLLEDICKLITIAYLHQVVDFTMSNGGEA